MMTDSIHEAIERLSNRAHVTTAIGLVTVAALLIISTEPSYGQQIPRAADVKQDTGPSAPRAQPPRETIIKERTVVVEPVAPGPVDRRGMYRTKGDLEDAISKMERSLQRIERLLEDLTREVRGLKSSNRN